jgi:tetratricopeptide (TPR) repeat protein|tara:strand:- start:99 stop:1769 length:1671 start_codon:yes stop_codon:yes gene_type:complete
MSRQTITECFAVIIVVAGVACGSVPDSQTGPVVTSDEPVVVASNDAENQPDLSRFSGELTPVVLPELSQLSASIQDQIRTQYDRVSQLRESDGDSLTALSEAHGELGMILMATNLDATATDAFLHAHAQDPQELRWPYYLAQLLRENGDTDGAIEFYRRSLRLDPAYLAAQVWLGEVYLDASRSEEAEASFRQALDVNPSSAAALSGLGRAALAVGDAERAVEYLEQALDAGPTAWNLHYSLAAAYRTLGDLEKVEFHLQQRGGDPPRPYDPLMEAYDGLLQSARAYENRGTQAMGEGRYEEAAAIFSEGLAETPDDAGLHHWLGATLMVMGDSRGAGEQFAEALRLDPEYADSHLGLGALLLDGGRFSEALEQFETAVEIRPNYFQARLGLADALRATGDFEGAVEQLDRVIELDPSFVDGWMARAMTQIQLGQFREARDGLRQGVIIHAGHPSLSDLLVRILAAAPDAEVRDGMEAVSIMQERFKGPVSLEMYETMAMALAEVGRYDEAANWQRQAMSVAEQNDRSDVARMMAEALALYEQGRPARSFFSQNPE